MTISAIRTYAKKANVTNYNVEELALELCDTGIWWSMQPFWDHDKLIIIGYKITLIRPVAEGRLGVKENVNHIFDETLAGLFTKAIEWAKS